MAPAVPTCWRLVAGVATVAVAGSEYLHAGGTARCRRDRSRDDSAAADDDVTHEAVTSLPVGRLSGQHDEVRSNEHIASGEATVRYRSALDTDRFPQILRSVTSPRISCCMPAAIVNPAITQQANSSRG